LPQKQLTTTAATLTTAKLLLDCRKMLMLMPSRWIHYQAHFVSCNFGSQSICNTFLLGCLQQIAWPKRVAILQKLFFLSIFFVFGFFFGRTLDSKDSLPSG